MGKVKTNVILAILRNEVVQLISTFVIHKHNHLQNNNNTYPDDVWITATFWSSRSYMKSPIIQNSQLYLFSGLKSSGKKYNHITINRGCITGCRGCITGWGDALLDVYLVQPESSVTSSSIVQGISDHSEVILEVDWVENYREPQVERVVPMYKKTDVLGLQTFLSEKFPEWAISGRSVEEIWNNFKNIVCESLERCVPYRILRKNSDPENYNKEIKRLK